MYYFQHNINDFNGGTKNFTRLERWLYRDMIEMYYDTESPLPADFEILCDDLGVTSNEEKAAVSRILRRKFTLTDSGYWNERCDEGIATYHAAAETARTNGKKGGRPPKNNPNKPSGFPSGSDPVPNGLPKQTEQEPDGNHERTGSQANQEPITINQKPVVQPHVPPEGETAGPVRAVFDYWQKAMDHQRAQLDAKRARNIRARLKDGYTPEQLCKAVDGCKLSPHHMGKNDTGTVYDDIELICRDGSRIDKFIRLAEKSSLGCLNLDPRMQTQVDAINEWMQED